MYIQVERGADVGVAKNRADCLVVAFTFDAACREAVSKAMEFDVRDAEPFQKPVIMIPVGSRLCRAFISGQDIIFP